MKQVILRTIDEVIRRYKLFNLEAQLAEAGFKREGEGELCYTTINRNNTRVTDNELASMMRRVDSHTLLPWEQCYSPVDSPCTPREIFIELEKAEQKTNPNTNEKYFSQRYTIFVKRQGI